MAFRADNEIGLIEGVRNVCWVNSGTRKLVQVTLEIFWFLEFNFQRNFDSSSSSNQYSTQFAVWKFLVISYFMHCHSSIHVFLIYDARANNWGADREKLLREHDLCNASSALGIMQKEISSIQKGMNLNYCVRIIIVIFAQSYIRLEFIIET